MNKVCKKCGSEKPFMEFYPCPKMKTGVLNECKDCYRKRVLERSKSPEVKEAHKAASARFRQLHKRDAKYVAYKADYHRRRYKKHPEKISANNAAKYAMRTGKLVRQPCEVCGTTENIHAHHDDYSKKLDVRWLCGFHHREHHNLGKFPKLQVG